MVQPEELVRMAAKVDGQAAIEPTINLSDDTGDKRTELGDLNPWTDTTKPAPAETSNNFLSPFNPSANLSPTSSAASPLARVDASILAEFDPFSSHDVSSSSSSNPGTPVNNERDTEDTQKGNPPGLVLSGIFPSGQGDTGAVAEEVDTQANKSSSTTEPSVPKKNISRESGPDHGATSEPTAELGSQRISPSSTPPPSLSAPRTPSKAVQNTDSSRPSSIRQGKEDSSVRQRQGDEEEDRPSEPAFDFQGFLVQLRSRQAEPIQKYLKSFLVSFAKRPFTINDQIKLIHDFLEFIAEKMRQTDPWKGQTEAEFEQSMEAMEKLVMNRLYTYTFSPMIDHSVYPITTDDLEKDFVLSERIRIFSWVREKHLDVPEGEASQGFLAFAEQELLKINHYKAPRDKMICILNCCKVIFGLIRHVAGSDNTSADAFLPILIFVVIRANPDNMISNIEYINRFRSAPRLQGEAGYYLSSLGGAISFIETMDASGLSNITREEFEENVGRAVAEMPPAEPRNARGPQGPNSASTVNAAWSNTAEGEEPARDLTSLPGNIALDTKRFFQRTGEFATEAVSRPLSALGKMIESIGGTADEEGNDYPGSAYRQPSYRGGDRGEMPRTPSFQNRIRAPRPVYRSPSGQGQNPQPTASPLGGLFGRRQPDVPHGVPSHPEDRLQVNEMYARHQVDFATPPPGPMTPSDDPTFNFTELTAEIDRNTTTARQAGIDTLHQMFPDIDREIAGVILDSCQNDLGQAIDRMLEMAAG